MLEVCRDTAEEFIPAWRSVEIMHLGETGAAERAASEVAEEVPIGFIYHGFPHAVMMATPRDLQDFAVGFSLSEGFARDADDILTTQARATEDGIALSITLAPAALRRFLARRRTRSLRGHTSCGICGVEELADVRQAGARVCAGRPVSRRAVQTALASLREFQPLSRSTRGAHAAAWVDSDGRILLAREDVGRHNALDKLIGACLRERHRSRRRLLPDHQPLLVRDGAEGGRCRNWNPGGGLGADRAGHPHGRSGRRCRADARSRPGAIPLHRSGARPASGRADPARSRPMTVKPKAYDAPAGGWGSVRSLAANLAREHVPDQRQPRALAPEQAGRLHVRELRLGQAGAAASVRVLRERRQGDRVGDHQQARRPGVLRRAHGDRAAQPGPTTTSRRAAG